MADPQAPEVRSRAEARRHRRARIFTAVGIGMLVAILAGVAVVVVSGGNDTDRPKTIAPKPKPATIDTGPNITADYGRVRYRTAATKGGDITVYGSPTDAAAPTTTLSAKTEYLVPRTLLVFDQWQDWLHVYLPERPNGSTAWVKAGDVSVSDPLDYQIRISLADHHLTVLKDGVVTFETDVAIGTEQYPTPTGFYYLTDPIDLHKRPNLGYGVFAYGISAHSDVLTDFMGGDGQIGLHGTNNPGDIGRDVSHGCVRMLNEAIEKIAELPIGTPVTIV
jgi:lipoprotein-anchoring transpeptidase ErfK/SrfK